VQTTPHVPGGENKQKKYKIANDHALSATKPAEGRPALMRLHKLLLQQGSAIDVLAIDDGGPDRDTAACQTTSSPLLPLKARQHAGHIMLMPWH